MANEVTWQLWFYDVWGNANDGWDVNDRSCHNRQFVIPAVDPANPTDEEIEDALGPDRRVMLELEWQDEDTIEFGDGRQGSKPIGQLIRNK